MHIVLAGLFLFGFFVLLLIGSGVVERVVVPIAVGILGESHFAETSALDIGSRGPMLGFGILFCATVGRIYLPTYYWLIVFVALLTAVDLVWLWWLGKGASEREWTVGDAGIYHLKTKEQLKPTFIWSRQDYFQTDAYHGYSLYALELYEEAGLRARNEYRSEADWIRDKTAALELCPQCRQLDLHLSAPLSDSSWQIFPFYDYWTPYLCGALEAVSEESRAWWRQWVLPNFDPANQISVDRDDWDFHVNELLEAYPELREKLDNDWTCPDRWRRLMNRELPILAMGEDTFQKMAREAHPEGRTLLYQVDGTVEVR
jgi:hypothetical protein